MPRTKLIIKQNCCIHSGCSSFFARGQQCPQEPSLRPALIFSANERSSSRLLKLDVLCEMLSCTKAGREL